MIISRVFLRSKMLWYVQNFQQNVPHEKQILPQQILTVESHSSCKGKMSPALCKFAILFSAVKLKLRPNFSQYTYRFKIGAFESWT